jgi:hypothetical protein
LPVRRDRLTSYFGNIAASAELMVAVGAHNYITIEWEKDRVSAGRCLLLKTLIRVLQCIES